MPTDIVTRADIPAAITTYMQAHRERNAELALPLFWPDATVTDESATHSGADAIRRWIDTAASEYAYTATETGYSMSSPDHVQVFVRLEGNFPGGVADVVYDFQLQNDKIARLVID